MMRMVWPIYIPPIAKNDNVQKNLHNFRRKCPYRHEFWDWFLGLEWKNNLVGQENPSCPGRMNTSCQQETSIIYVMYVRTSCGRWFARHHATARTSPKAWPVPVRRGHANARPPKAGKVMRRSLGRVQMQRR